MLFDDDELDPDSAAGCAAMMQALDDAETGCASTPFPQGLNESQERAIATGHSYHAGPPNLRCSAPWGLQLLREADGTHPALHAASDALEALQARSELTVNVDWGNLVLKQLPGVVKLLVCRAGVPVGTAEGHVAAPLSLSFSVAEAEAGEVFVAELRWEGGSRHLHCLAPLRARSGSTA